MTRLIEIRKGRPIVVRDATGAVKFSSADRMPHKVPRVRVRKQIDLEWGYGPSLELPSKARTQVLGSNGNFYRVYQDAYGERDWPLQDLPPMREFNWMRGTITVSSVEMADAGGGAGARAQQCLVQRVPLAYAGGSVLLGEWQAVGTGYETWKWSWFTPVIVGRKAILRTSTSQVAFRTNNVGFQTLVIEGGWMKARVSLDLDVFTWEGNRV